MNLQATKILVLLCRDYLITNARKSKIGLTVHDVEDKMCHMKHEY